MGVKARLELVSRKSEQELQPGEQYIARLMLVLDLVIETGTVASISGRELLGAQRKVPLVNSRIG
jgi:hypothetical protein